MKSEEVDVGKREGERSEQESVVTRQNKDSRRDGGHAPPQRHPESRERGDRKGVNGGKREGERSERESVVPRHNIYRSPENLTSLRSFAAIFAITALLPTVTSIFLARVTAVYSRFRVMSGAGQRRAGITTNGYSLP